MVNDRFGISESPEFSEPLRPWLPADLLDNAARTISENKAVMLGLPVIAGIGLTAVQAGLTQVAVPGGVAGVLDSDDPFAGAGVSLAVVYAVQLLLFTVVSTLLSGIIALAAVRSQLGHRVGARELLRLVWPSMPALVGVAVVQSLAFVVLMSGWFLAVFGAAFGVELAGSSGGAGAIALVLMLVGAVLVVVVGIRLSMSGTAVLLEGRKAPPVGLYVPARVGVGGALKRSWLLVRGKFWRVFGVLLFAGVVVWVVGYALQLGVTLLVTTLVAWSSIGDSTAGIVVTIVIGTAAGVSALLVTIASLAFVSAVQALLYLDLRVRREGLDLWLRPALMPTGGPAVRPTDQPER